MVATIKKKKPSSGIVMMPAVVMPEGPITPTTVLPVINFAVLPRIGEKIHFGERVQMFPAGRYVVRDVIFQPLSPQQVVHRLIIRPVMTEAPNQPTEFPPEFAGIPEPAA